jgi:hypothetical protein
MRNTQKYAIRLGFGQEGHGQAIYVAAGPTAAAARAAAVQVLQAQFGALWTNKLRDTYIGSQAWLAREFPGEGLEKALADAEA